MTLFDVIRYPIDTDNPIIIDKLPPGIIVKWWNLLCDEGLAIHFTDDNAYRIVKCMRPWFHDYPAHPDRRIILILLKKCIAEWDNDDHI